MFSRLTKQHTFIYKMCKSLYLPFEKIQVPTEEQDEELT